MNANDAAAIAAVCAALIAIVNVVGQVIVGRKVNEVHGLVDGMANKRARKARAAGVAAGRAERPRPLIPPPPPESRPKGL